MNPETAPEAEEKTLLLKLKQIRLDGGTQSRARLDGALVAKYAEEVKAGDKFPPIVVFWDGKDYWLASGFHRWHAHQQANRLSIEAQVRQGDVRAAKLFAVGCNGTHGKRRNPEDLSHALRMLLTDPEWSRWSNSEIARHCKCDRNRVREEKESLEREEELERQRELERRRATDAQRAASPAQPSGQADRVATLPQGPSCADRVTCRTKHGTVTTMKTVNLGGQRVRPIQVETEPGQIARQEVKIKRSIPKAVRQAKALGWTWEQLIEAMRKAWAEMPVAQAS